MIEEKGRGMEIRWCGIPLMLGCVGLTFYLQRVPLLLYCVFSSLYCVRLQTLLISFFHCKSQSERFGLAFEGVTYSMEYQPFFSPFPQFYLQGFRVAESIASLHLITHLCLVEISLPLHLLGNVSHPVPEHQ